LSDRRPAYLPPVALKEKGNAIWPSAYIAAHASPESLEGVILIEPVMSLRPSHDTCAASFKDRASHHLT
jgi:hypothetical protein